MPDEPKEPESPKPEPEGTWEVTDKGRVIIDGVDVTDMANPEYREEGDEPKADPDNVAVEGEVAEEPDEEEPEAEEPEKEEAEEAPPETPPEPEEPKEPEKLKFKLKFRGNEEEKEYTPDQIQVRLNKLRAFEENEKEFWQRTKEVEPYAEIVKSDWFKEKLKEGYEAGELEKPPEPPPPPTGLTYEHMKRKADPDYAEVVDALATYAMGLDPEAARLLDTDLTVFLPEYDRVAKEMREKKAEVAPKKEPPKPTPKELEKRLKFKEAAKEKAAVVKPGSAQEAPNPRKAWEKRDRELQRQLRDPANVSRNLEIAAELLDHRNRYPE